jgi:hypothetical protein
MNNVGVRVVRVVFIPRDHVVVQSFPNALFLYFFSLLKTSENERRRILKREEEEINYFTERRRL